jgi:hypothetical protein
MKSARQILEEFTASSFRDPKKAAEMFEVGLAIYTNGLADYKATTERRI